MKPDVSKYLPLSPATMHVLLALTSGDLHGYGILLEVTRQSQGAYKIGPGTLYDNLKKLLSQGLVEEAGSQKKEAAPRREYHLTNFGSAVLRAEMDRLSALIQGARRRLRVTEGTQA